MAILAIIIQRNYKPVRIYSPFNNLCCFFLWKKKKKESEAGLHFDADAGYTVICLCR